jgi:feruloyl esterase
VLPKSAWNGKYVAFGNGGWCGSISEGSLTRGARLHYAASVTDTGHTGCNARFALGHPEKLIDYAYRSEHEMAVKSKAIIEAFYGRAPVLSYWVGCSAGGKQGLMEAQRFPEDFDGIVAGSPAANWVGRASQAIWVAQAVHRDAASNIPPAKYPAIHRAVLAACDTLDGVADGVIENPRRCRFDPQTIACSGEETGDCLTAAQVATARKIYGDSVNPRTGKRLYSGLEPGSEMNWQIWGGTQPLSIALDHFKYVVFQNPAWDYRTLDFDRDIELAQGMDTQRINATNADLHRFFDRGGKLIQYHGWNDAQISPGNSVDYYESVLMTMGGREKVHSSYRLFMVPGMDHCSGGDGAYLFDPLTALEQWREQGLAPKRLIARTATVVPRTHPLCPYPEEAVYKGSGSTADEANYDCALREKDAVRQPR